MDRESLVKIIIEVKLMNCNELRSKARLALTGKWMTSALVYFVFSVISIAISRIFKGIWSIPTFLLTIPLYFGLVYVFLGVTRGADPKLEGLFEGFKDYVRVVVTGVLVNVYTLLWSLLLIVPGIIASISYSMTFYILIDDPQIKYNDAIKLSKEMMNGHKSRYFMLMLSFIGWWLLAILTLGIGTFWVASYMSTAQACFYEDLKVNQIRDRIIGDTYNPENQDY